MNFTDEMQHEYTFNPHFDLERIHMNEVNAISNQLEVFIKYLSLEIINYEILYDSATITYVDKGFKEIKIAAKRFYILDEPCKEEREIIVGPRKSKNSLTYEKFLKMRTPKKD